MHVDEPGGQPSVYKCLPVQWNSTDKDWWDGLLACNKAFLHVESPTESILDAKTYGIFKFQVFAHLACNNKAITHFWTWSKYKMISLPFIVWLESLVFFTDTGFGTIYVSDDRGTVYSKSLERHLYTTTGGDTDFTNVTSLRGVFITSILAEGLCLDNGRTKPTHTCAQISCKNTPTLTSSPLHTSRRVWIKYLISCSVLNVMLCWSRQTLDQSCTAFEQQSPWIHLTEILVLMFFNI